MGTASRGQMVHARWPADYALGMQAACVALNPQRLLQRLCKHINADFLASGSEHTQHDSLKSAFTNFINSDEKRPTNYVC